MHSQVKILILVTGWSKFPRGRLVQSMPVVLLLVVSSLLWCGALAQTCQCCNVLERVELSVVRYELS